MSVSEALEKNISIQSVSWTSILNPSKLCTLPDSTKTPLLLVMGVVPGLTTAMIMSRTDKIESDKSAEREWDSEGGE